MASRLHISPVLPVYALQNERSLTDRIYSSSPKVHFRCIDRKTTLRQSIATLGEGIQLGGKTMANKKPQIPAKKPKLVPPTKAEKKLAKAQFIKIKDVY
jgi:hypothetical protein